ncbi:hypothetical protein C5E11_03895 [Clavibacter michiganensis]|nr:hypothetical protein C5E11_03895 [Clavibacter michiganensis]
MITADDLTGVDELTAHRILAVAHTIAPCLDTLDGEPKSRAIAVLRGVAADVLPRGSRRVKSQRIGPASVEYFDAASWFSTDDRAALRGLCQSASAGNTPIGQFPRPGILKNLWPEEK